MPGPVDGIAAEAAAVTEPATAPVPDAPDVPDVADADDLDLDGPTEGRTFDADYVAKLRSEAKQRRLAVKEYETKFAPLSALGDDNVKVLAQFAQDYMAGNDEAALGFLISSAKNLAGDRWHEIVGADTTPPEPEPDLADIDDLPLADVVAKAVADALAAQEADRERRASEEKYLNVARDHARTLGYDPASDEYKVLMQFAVTIPPSEGSIPERLDKAHQTLMGAAQKLAGARDTTDTGPDAASRAVGAPPKGQAPSSDRPDPSLSARERASQRIQAMIASELG